MKFLVDEGNGTGFCPSSSASSCHYLQALQIRDCHHERCGFLGGRRQWDWFLPQQFGLFLSLSPDLTNKRLSSRTLWNSWWTKAMGLVFVPAVRPLPVIIFPPMPATRISFISPTLHNLRNCRYRWINTSSHYFKVLSALLYSRITSVKSPSFCLTTFSASPAHLRPSYLSHMTAAAT